jgi:hypothetical protein
MPGVLKPLGNNIVSNSVVFSSVYGNPLVRITHSSATTGSALVTCKDSTNTNILWTMVITGGNEVIVQKNPTDLLTSNSTDTSLNMCPVAYKN